ncbi:MAG: hypothetical protein GX946_01740 [Oligosphaeraceae bacterium]|nr:hypothetical protein [Oligosphaeraceae bacterium]
MPVSCCGTDVGIIAIEDKASLKVVAFVSIPFDLILDRMPSSSRQT